VTDAILSHQFPNGLVLVAEPMPWLDSAAFTFLAPCGSIHDPETRSGLSSFACEMMLRGAGPRDSRQLINDLDKLGVERGEGVADSHTSFSGAALASNLPQVLSIYADVIRRPHLPDDQLDAGRLVMEQELQSIEDDPQHKVMVELRRRHFPAPWGRPSQGDMEGVAAVSIDDIRGHWERLYRPNGAILGVAGRFDFNQMIDLVGELFGDWKPGPEIQIPQRNTRVRADHIPHEATQTQIGIAYPTVPYRHDDYFRAWAAVAVLSGGMSSRLFTEVREKRGLCYSVYASYHTYRELGAVLSYAGTTAARAQETLDVMTAELLKLEQGINAEEIDRLKTRVKTTLVMQQESSSSRSSSLARDWYHLGRARSLGEISGLVDALTLPSINSYLAEHPPRDFTFLTLGPEPLTPPSVPELASSNGHASSVAPFEFKQHRLANGLEIVAECQPSAASSAVAFFVSTGARDETPELSGVSHFLEHMVFKGTPTRTPEDVNREFDEIGAQFNAFTSDENTCYYAFVLPEYLEKVVQLWADVLRPSLREEDFTKEKQVILEEIGMYLDQPPYGADDQIKALYFGKHPLAGSVLGTKESVSAIQAEGMRKYFEARYSPRNIVIAAVGQINFPKLVEWAEKYCGSWKPFEVSRKLSQPEFKPSFLAIEKPTSTQQYLMHMAPGPGASDADRYAAKLLSMVLGDDTGSRLYWELVDPGLAESVSLGHIEYVDCGSYSTFLSCDPERTEDNLARILAAFRKAEAEGITAEELEQAKSKINSNVVLRGERPRGRLFTVGGNWSLRREYRSMRDDLDTVAAITVADVNAVLKRYPLSKGTIVTIGPATGLKGPE